MRAIIILEEGYFNLSHSDLTKKNPIIRTKIGPILPLEMSVNKIEHLLYHKHRRVRVDACLLYFRQSFEHQKAKKEEHLKLLDDEYWLVRKTFAELYRFTPTVDQFDKGMNDSHAAVREVFKNREAEWKDSLDRERLMKKHKSLTTKPEVEAL